MSHASTQFPKGSEAWPALREELEFADEEAAFDAACEEDRKKIYEERSVCNMQGATAGVSGAYVDKAPIFFDGTIESIGEHVCMEDVPLQYQ